MEAGVVSDEESKQTLVEHDVGRRGAGMAGRWLEGAADGVGGLKD